MASKLTVNPGDQVTLTYYGGSFAPGAKVQVGDKTITGKRSADGKRLTFRVPKDAEEGPVTLKVIDEVATTRGPRLEVE